MQRALDIFEASLPEGHPYITGVRENLAGLVAARAAAEDTVPETGTTPLPERRGLLSRLFGRGS